MRTKGGSAWGKENSTPCGWFQNRTSRPAPHKANHASFRCSEQAKSSKVYVKTRQHWHLAACLVNVCLRWESCTWKIRRLRRRSDLLSSQNMTKSKWRLGKVRCTSICLQHPVQPRVHSKCLSLCSAFFRAISIFNLKDSFSVRHRKKKSFHVLPNKHSRPKPVSLALGAYGLKLTELHQECQILSNLMLATKTANQFQLHFAKFKQT